jgi:hypothetical protein
VVADPSSTLVKKLEGWLTWLYVSCDSIAGDGDGGAANRHRQQEVRHAATWVYTSCDSKTVTGGWGCGRCAGEQAGQQQDIEGVAHMVVCQLQQHDITSPEDKIQ